MIEKDLKSLGYVFQWSKLDAQNYCLTQRRTRVYGLGDIDDGQNAQELSANMAATLSSMESVLKFKFEEMFDVNLPKCPLTGNALENVKEALDKAAVNNESSNIFVDTSSSSSWSSETGFGVATCVRPSHPIYSVSLGRNLTVEELFKCQGIFKQDFANPQAIEDCLQIPRKAQDLAGNAFASTCAQVQLLASLVHARGWRSIGGKKEENVITEASDDSGMNIKDDSQSSTEVSSGEKMQIPDFFDPSPPAKRARFSKAPAWTGDCFQDK